MAPSDNPLLGSSDRLPAFDQIEVAHVVPAIQTLLEELGAELDRLESELDSPTWDSVIEPLERLQDRLRYAWGTTNHLMAVQNSPELREAHTAVQPHVIEFSMRLGQSPAIFQALEALRDSDEYAKYDEAQKRIVESLLRSAEHAGVGLEGDERDRFNALQQEAGSLRTKFQNNVLDATKAFRLDLTESSDVEGLPESLLRLAAQAYGEGATAEEGPWRITLDFPSYGPFMEHSQRRDLRQQMLEAFITRASSGEHDNSENVERLLEIRREMAHLLGFETYAELSLDAKMADGVEAIEKLTDELRSRAFDRAESEFEELCEFAKKNGADHEIVQWDIPFWAERLREAKFDFTDEELRPYFPLPRVLDGLFEVATRLFGVTIVAADDRAPKWHEDVRYFEIQDESGETIASFYLDPYSRPAEKRGGAWMDECLSRSSIHGELRKPVAYLVCNQTPPVGDTPSLMTFTEVLTLFHEFGHGLQHMLTRVDYGLAAGIRGVEWDAVELPSQFMENWCYLPTMLKRLSGHYETGDPLPDELVDKIIEARTYRAASQLLRQLYIGSLDLDLHYRYDPDSDEDAFDRMRAMVPKFSVLKPLENDRFLCAFSHVFAGAYAAGYYSYKWAEVLSADAFAAFEEAGLENEEALRETGRRFRDTVLGCGGGEHPMEVFKRFRGRAPSTEALLRHTGLAS
ncbi:MAG: M3 family metallopeptidase [Planctomycetota bacterium]